MMHGDWQILHALLTGRSDPETVDNDRLYELEELGLIRIPSVYPNGTPDWEEFWAEPDEYVTAKGRNTVWP